MKTLTQYVRESAFFYLTTKHGRATLIMGAQRKSLCTASTISDIVAGQRYTLRPRTFVTVESEAQITPSKLERARCVKQTA